MKASSQKPGTISSANKPTAPPPHFDKLKTVNTLRAAAFGENQAGAIVEAIDDAQRYLATKSDLDQAVGLLHTDVEKVESGLRADMEKMRLSLRADMEKMRLSLRADMEKMELSLRTDMGKMGLSLRADMEKMGLSLRADMEAKSQKLYWHILATAGGTAGVVTGILSIVLVLVGTK